MRGKSLKNQTIDTLEAAHALFAPAFARASNERLYVAHLDENARLIGLRIRYGAGDGTVEFPFRGIISDALALRSKALVIAHNHPSGDPTPSATDIRETRKLVQVAGPIGLMLRDHLVFGDGGAFVSFRQTGLL